MNISRTLQKVVVDRGGLPYPRRVNTLALANLPGNGTETRRVPRLLANPNGPMRGANLGTGPDQNAKEPRCG